MNNRFKKILGGETPASYGCYGAFLPFVILALFGDLLWKKGLWVLSDFGSDLLPYFLPTREFGFAHLRRWDIPFWDPYIYSGAPFFAGIQTALLYPFNWQFLLLRPAAAVNTGVAFHVFLGGLFLYLWLAYRKLHPAACLFGAAVFMMAGPHFLQISQGHLSNLCTLVWAPLIFLAVDGWKQSRSVRWVLLGILAVSLQILAGHPQYVFYTFLGLLLYAGGHISSVENKMKFLGGLVLFYLGALCLTAIQLFTSLTVNSETFRGTGLSLEVASTFFLPLENVLTLVMPHIFGGTGPVAYWGRGTYSEVCLFMGVIPFWLAILGLGGERKENRVVILMVVASFILALGPQTFFFNLSYGLIPFFRDFRGTDKFDFLLILFLAVLAGMGLNRLLKKETTPPSALIVFVFVFGFLSIIYGLYLSLSGEGSPEKVHFISDAQLEMAESLSYLGKLSLLFSLILLGIKKSKNSKYLLMTLVFLGIGELFLFDKSHRPLFDINQYEARKQALEALYKTEPGDYRITTPFGDADIPMGYDLWGFNPMVLARYARFIAASQGLEVGRTAGAVNIIKTPSPCLGLLRYRYQIRDDFQDLRVFPTHLRELKRAQFVDSFQVMDDEKKETEAVTNPGFDPAQKVILETVPNPLPQNAGHPGSVKVWDISTDEMEVEATLDHPSLLLISDNYAKDWRIKPLEPGGQKDYTVMPADLTLRAVPLSAGRHHFLMEYRPAIFETGKTISEFSLLAFGIASFFVFRPRKNKGRR